MFAIPMNFRSIGIQLLCVIAFGITYFPVYSSRVPTNETCINISSEIVCFFKGSEEAMTWNEARQLCNSSNATLPVIRNRNDQNAVANRFRSRDFGEVWTAGKIFTYRNWTWINGEKLENKVQLQDNRLLDGENEYYAAIDTDFNFKAERAATELYYICQYEGAYCDCSSDIMVNEKCLRLINDKRTWYDARNQCIRNNGDLAVLVDGASELLKNVAINQRYWIGLRKKYWRWIWNDHADSNDEIKYTNFQVLKGGCITIEGDKWTAENCTKVKGVVCQRGQGVTSNATTSEAFTNRSIIRTCTSVAEESRSTTDGTQSSTSQPLLFAVIGVLVIIICIFIVVIVFVLKNKKGKSHDSKHNQSSEQANHETLYSNVSQAPADTYANAAANAEIDRSDGNGVEYAEIELLNPVQLEDEGTIQPPGISYTSLAAKEQMEDGGANRQPRTTYVSLESKEDPEYMEVAQNRARSTAASRKVGPLGDMYAMPGCKGQVVTSPGVEAASQPVKVVRKDETVYANLQTDLAG